MEKATIVFPISKEKDIDMRQAIINIADYLVLNSIIPVAGDKFETPYFNVEFKEV